MVFICLTYSISLSPFQAFQIILNFLKIWIFDFHIPTFSIPALASLQMANSQKETNVRTRRYRPKKKVQDKSRQTSTTPRYSVKKNSIPSNELKSKTSSQKKKPNKSKINSSDYYFEDDTPRCVTNIGSSSKNKQFLVYGERTFSIRNHGLFLYLKVS